LDFDLLYNFTAILKIMFQLPDKPKLKNHISLSNKPKSESFSD